MTYAEEERTSRKRFAFSRSALEGNDTVYEQNAYTWILRAGCELGLGPGKDSEVKAVKCVEKAWQCGLKIVSLSAGMG